MSGKPSYKVGDLIQVCDIIRRDHQSRKRRSDVRRPPSPKGPTSSMYAGQFGIVTEAYHYNQFWRGMEPGPNDHTYICYMQELGEYFILCENEIEKVT